MKTEDISANHPPLANGEAKSNNPLRKPLKLMQHFFTPKEKEEAPPHKIVHTPHVNNHLLRPYLTQPAIDSFYMKVISVLEQSMLSPIQARTILREAHILCVPDGDKLTITCSIQHRPPIIFTFGKPLGATLYSQLKTYAVLSAPG